MCQKNRDDAISRTAFDICVRNIVLNKNSIVVQYIINEFE